MDDTHLLEHILGGSKGESGQMGHAMGILGSQAFQWSRGRSHGGQESGFTTKSLPAVGAMRQVWGQATRRERTSVKFA